MSKAKRSTGKTKERARNLEKILRAIRESNRRTGKKNSAADKKMAYRLEEGLHADAIRRATETPAEEKARMVAGVMELIRVFGKPFARKLVHAALKLAKARKAKGGGRG